MTRKTNLVRRATSPCGPNMLIKDIEVEDADVSLLQLSSVTSCDSDWTAESSVDEDDPPSKLLHVQLSSKRSISKKTVYVKGLAFCCGATLLLIILAVICSHSPGIRISTNGYGFRTTNNVRGAATEAEPARFLTVTPEDDPIFASERLSERSYEQVRQTYKTDNEIQRPMAVVRLPDNFQGEYRPSTVEEFKTLAIELIDDAIDAPSPPSSRYGIVTICIGLDLCDIAEPNQRAYASKHGYDYLYLSRSIDGVPPKMLKYLVLTWAMARGYDWLLMLDADALITNPTIMLEDLVQMPSEYMSEATISPSGTEDINLIITRGGSWKSVHAINNGIFLLRNTAWSIRHCFEIFTSRYSFTRFLGRSLVDQPIQLSLLLAQNELMWPPKDEIEMGQHVMVVPKRRLNSFRRNPLYSNVDAEEGGQWERGDFLAHFASNNKYSLMVDLLDQEKLPGVPPVEARYSFPLPAPGVELDQYTNAGTCWCNDKQIHCMPKYHVIGVHKAGSKSLMRYLAGNSGLAHSPHVEDPVRWLTDSTLATEEKKCNVLREKDKAKPHYHGYPDPIYINKGDTSHALTTCSFTDYTLLHGKFTTNEGFCFDDKVPVKGVQKPMFDEMVIWEHGPSKVRGVGLPDLFHRLQPSARMLITIRDAVEVFYSAYNHFGEFGDTAKSPEHFHAFARDLTRFWAEAGCTVSNFRTCLPSDFVQGGSWLSRALYSDHLPLWLDSFGCSQIHLFDVSVDPYEEVQRLYDFMGTPNNRAAFNVTQAAYRAQEETKQYSTRNNALNKNSYGPLLDATRVQLEDFYLPYNKKLCDMMAVHECLRVPLFERYCHGVDYK